MVGRHFFNVGLKFVRPLLHPEHAPPRPIFISSTNKVIKGRDQWQTLVSLTVFNVLTWF